MFQEYRSTLRIAGKDITIKTGVLAKQANGSVVVECGSAVLLATAVMSKEPREGIDFFPLTVEFSEKFYASGKIPGGFFKREARPSTQATLIARLIDRPLRPSFPKNFFHDVQIIVTTLSFDESIPMEQLSIIAASAAVTVSDIPFNGPIGAANVGYINGELVVNPSTTQLEESQLDIIVAGTKDAIMMVESESKELPEETILDAIVLAHEHIKESIALQEDLQKQAGKEKVTLPEPTDHTPLRTEISAFIGDKIESNLQNGNKKEIEAFLNNLTDEVKNQFIKDDEDKEHNSTVMKMFNEIKKDQIRKTIITKKVRPDGRGTTEIRPIQCQTGLLPSVHGSSLFTRGETQSLGVVTLGTALDEQTIDGLGESKSNDYYFHYNFPPFSVGETGFLRTGRRELGHGALAERAIKAILPENFPYTIRIVSEILESNGSSSMASVCSGSLSLMDAGVPVREAVSGIAMGLLIENNNYTILSDIQGLEDHYGDMDFKVARTKNGINALQLDIKVGGLSKQILQEALTQAKEGCLHILDQMNAALDRPRSALSEHAPKIHDMTINPEKVGLVIGPGGKMIRKIEEETGASVLVSDGTKGLVTISSKNQESLDGAIKMITLLTKEPEVGEIYDGKVSKIVTFGVFVEVSPGKEGLVHISKLAEKRIDKIEDHIKVGELLKVKINNIDQQNRINLVPVSPLKV